MVCIFPFNWVDLGLKDLPLDAHFKNVQFQELNSFWQKKIWMHFDNRIRVDLF
jgi:hypothetical protein